MTSVCAQEAIDEETTALCCYIETTEIGEKPVHEQKNGKELLPMSVRAERDKQRLSMEEPSLFDKVCSQEARGKRNRRQWLDQIRHGDKGQAFVCTTGAWFWRSTSTTGSTRARAHRL